MYRKEEYELDIFKMKEYLGNICVACGSVENLEFDHIDPSIKKYDPTNLHGYEWSFVKAELDKCQLLCKKCHKEKHKAQHGNRSCYIENKCRCVLCKKANSDYLAKYKHERRFKKTGLVRKKINPLTGIWTEEVDNEFAFGASDVHT